MIPFFLILHFRFKLSSLTFKLCIYDWLEQNTRRIPCLQAIRLPEPKFVADELFKKNIIVSARGEGVWISASIFNNEEDVAALTKELAIILKR